MERSGAAGEAQRSAASGVLKNHRFIAKCETKRTLCSIARMAGRRRPKHNPILLAQFDDCLLGIMYPRPDEENCIPVAVYSAEMIAARLRDNENMTMTEARCFVTDRIEQNYLGPGTPRIIWPATAEDFGEVITSQ